MALMLDKAGIFLALTMAFCIIVFSSWQYLALILVFFFLSLIVTKYEYYAKKEMAIYEHERSWENVLSNGLIPTITAILSSSIGPFPFIASVSAITSDKFASELGVLSGKAYAIPFFNEVKPGTSGAITLFGTWMSLVGASLIGLASIFLFSLTPKEAALISLFGFLGSVIDSAFGVLEERGIGTKGTTNFICALSGAILAYLFFK